MESAIDKRFAIAAMRDTELSSEQRTRSATLVALIELQERLALLDGTLQRMEQIHGESITILVSLCETFDRSVAHKAASDKVIDGVLASMSNELLPLAMSVLQKDCPDVEKPTSDSGVAEPAGEAVEACSQDGLDHVANATQGRLTTPTAETEDPAKEPSNGEKTDSSPTEKKKIAVTPNEKEDGVIGGSDS